MPICFICCGILLIFLLCFVFDTNFWGSKLNHSLILLYLVMQIFSFFIKDVNIFNISIVYFVPVIFCLILFILNIKHFNIIKLFTIAVLIATLLLAIGFIDNSFIEFIDVHIFEVCLVVSAVTMMFSKNSVENFIALILGFVLFVFGILLKQSISLDLTNVVVLNCFTLCVLFAMFFQYFKTLTFNLIRRLNNEKVKNA